MGNVCCTEPPNKKGSRIRDATESKDKQFKAWDADLFIMGRMIGKGSFAEVRAAKMKSNDKSVAIKRIALKNLNTEEILDIESEVVVLSQLKHPNIVEFVEKYEDKSYVYLVMEYVKGPILYDRVLERAIRKDEIHGAENNNNQSITKTMALLTEDSIAFYIQQILEALAYMHRKNLLHGDIKPENMVFRSKHSKKLKLVDFGYAVQRNKCSFLDIPRGTPIYMAPEYLTGKYTEQVDIWAVGVITFELLFGYPPFTSKWMKPRPLKFNPMKTVEFASKGLQIDQPGKGPWINTEIPISEDAKSFIRAMLRTDPAKRITATEALHHPWICEDHTMNMVSPVTAQSLLNYSNLTDIERFFKPFLTDMQHHIDEHVLEKFNNTFKKMDKDGTGAIGFQAFCEVMQSFGVEFPDLHLKNIFEGLDTNQQGTVRYTEFMDWLAWHHVTIQDDRLWVAITDTFANEHNEISLQSIHQKLADNPELSAKIPKDCLKALEMLFNERDIINVDELMNQIHYDNGCVKADSNLRFSHVLKKQTGRGSILTILPIIKEAAPRSSCRRSIEYWG